MLDHLGFGVSDVATGKAFFTAALAPLGYTAVMEGGGVGVGIGIGEPILWLAPAEQTPAPLHIGCHPPTARSSTRSTKRHSPPAARTMARRGCGRTTTRTTTRRS